MRDMQKQHVVRLKNPSAAAAAPPFSKQCQKPIIPKKSISMISPCIKWEFDASKPNFPRRRGSVWTHRQTIAFDSI